jgi:hypothetical protein
MNTTNPKDTIGAKKLSLSKLPAAGIIHGADAMTDGAEKYGAYNWRQAKVRASIYVDATLRHLLAWFEGEETAPDSGVHHLGHVVANASIVLDALACGQLVDDRPSPGIALAGLLEAIRARRHDSPSQKPLEPA